MKNIYIVCAIAAVSAAISLAAIAEDKQPSNEIREQAKKLHHQAKELREQGKIDAAERVEQELKALIHAAESNKKEGIKEGVKKESGNKEGVKKEGAVKEGVKKEGGNKEQVKSDPKERMHHLKLAIEHLRAAGHNELAQKLGEEFKHAEGKNVEHAEPKIKNPHPDQKPTQKPKGESNDTESLRREVQELKAALQEIRAHLKEKR